MFIAIRIYSEKHTLGKHRKIYHWGESHLFDFSIYTDG